MIETETAKVERPGNGSATSFSFSFDIYEPRVGGPGTHDLYVVRVFLDETEEVLSEGTGTNNYLVSVTEYPGPGSITFPASGPGRLQTGEKLVIKRQLNLLQEIDLTNASTYFPDTLEQGLDKAIAIDIQQQEEIDRAIKVPLGSSKTSDEILSDILTAGTDAQAAATQAEAAQTAAEAAQEVAEDAADEAQASAVAAAAAAASGLFSGIYDENADFTIVANDDNAKLFKIDSTGGNVQVTLPDIGVAEEGERYGFLRPSASNTITLVRFGTDTINGVAGNYVLTAVAGEITVIVADVDTPNNWLVLPWAQSTADGTSLTKTGAVIALNLANPNTWTAPQRAANVAANAGSFDMSAKNDFTCTPTGAAALTFTNKVSGQRGMILLNNTSNYAITRASGVEADSEFNALVSATGKYLISYWCYDGSNVALSYSGAIS
jgi:hypothetical protein